MARVPLRRRSFTGFIIGLLVDDRLYHFTTYNGAELTGLHSGAGEVKLAARRKKLQLRLRALRAPGAALAAPRTGAMLGRIEETLNAEIEVDLTEKGRPLWRSTGCLAGLEVVHPEKIAASLPPALNQSPL